MAVDQPKVALDKAMAVGVIGPKPGLVSARAARSTLHGVVSLAGVGLGAGSSLADERLLVRRAAHEGNPLVVGVGGTEVAIKVHPGRVLNSGV